MKLKSKISQSYGSNQKTLYTFGADLVLMQNNEDKTYANKGIGCKIKETLKV